MTTLTPQNETLLRQAVASGRFVSSEQALNEAFRLLHEASEDGSAESHILPPDQWVEEFDRITTSRHRGNPQMDDTRESFKGLKPLTELVRPGPYRHPDGVLAETLRVLRQKVDDGRESTCALPTFIESLIGVRR